MLPQAKVGGGFLQGMLQADGSTLVVLGDVSGKGLQAALMVSLIVGGRCER
jgi:serine phosphatase RsbU (regulator of sigma subunit)